MSSALIAASSVFMAISTSAAIFSFHFSRTRPMQARYISFFLAFVFTFSSFLTEGDLLPLKIIPSVSIFSISIYLFLSIIFRNQLYVIPCFSTNKRTLQRSSRFHIKRTPGLICCPFTLISKCRCSVVARPVRPVSPTGCPALTVSPTATRFFEL